MIRSQDNLKQLILMDQRMSNSPPDLFRPRSWPGTVGFNENGDRLASYELLNQYPERGVCL